MNKNNHIKRNRCIFDLILFIVLIFLDQITKYLAVQNLKNQSSYVLMDGVFELHYLENRGAAFGMMQNGKIFFIFANIVMFVAVIYILAKTPDDSKYTKWHVLLTCIAAGGMGNLIDRIRLDYVIDFLYFSLINFPIFNVADIYVTVCTILLVLMIFFFTKENELAFLSLNIKDKKSK